MTLEIIISSIAAILTTLSFLPQAIKTIKSQDTKGISLLMYVLFTIGVAFWAILGFIINNYPMIIANIITFILAAVILLMKIRNYLVGDDR
ncbi:MAG: SemiSWEET transporter [Proteobacteria bacterium]|nr:SemiSWEET transporter [Pseudomonadota bacterium]